MHPMTRVDDERTEQHEFLEVLAGLTHRHRSGPLDVAAEHEVGGAAMPPSPVGAATSFALGTAAATAIAAGQRNENTLTNLVFAARHPEMGGRPISAGEGNLAGGGRGWSWGDPAVGSHDRDEAHEASSTGGTAGRGGFLSPGWRGLAGRGGTR